MIDNSLIAITQTFDMRWRRRVALANAGYTLRAAAAQLGVTEGAISRECAGHWRSKYVRCALAMMAGVPHSWMWPREPQAPELSDKQKSRLSAAGIEVQDEKA